MAAIKRKRMGMGLDDGGMERSFCTIASQKVSEIKTANMSPLMRVTANAASAKEATKNNRQG
jgi:hypothetical protein